MDSSLLRTVINGVKGYAIQPFLNPQELKQLLIAMMTDEKVKRVALVDLGPSEMIVLLIRMLTLLNVEVVYIDHHESDQKDLANYHQIVDMLGSQARILPGSEAPAATTMVRIGEWQHSRIDVVFFHDDLDGYLSFIKGCYEKKLYESIDYDAVKFEGWGNGAGYSVFANLYLQAITLGPSFAVDPLQRQINRARLYTMFERWIHHNLSDSYIASCKREIEKEFEAISSLTQKLLQQIEDKPGVIYVDCYAIFAQGVKPNMSILKAEMFKMAKNEKLIAIRLIGKFGDQVSIFAPKRFKKNFKLYQLLPYEEKDNWHRETRLHIPYDAWSSYLKKIQQFY